MPFTPSFAKSVGDETDVEASSKSAKTIVAHPTPILENLCPRLRTENEANGNDKGVSEDRRQQSD
jgi:hypothetical protein